MGCGYWCTAPGERVRAQVSRVADQKQMREAHGAGSGVSSTRTTIPEACGGRAVSAGPQRPGWDLQP